MRSLAPQNILLLSAFLCATVLATPAHAQTIGSVIDFGTPEAVPRDGAQPAIACDLAGTCLSAWAADSIYVAVTDHDGRVTIPRSIEIPGSSAGAGRIQGLDVASNGTDFLVVWGDDRQGVRAARVAPSGQVLDSAPLAINSYGRNTYPSVASDGRNFVVIWDYLTNGAPGAALARAVSESGQLLGSGPVVVSPDSNNDNRGVNDSEIAWDGQGLRAFWQDSQPVDGTGLQVRTATLGVSQGNLSVQQTTELGPLTQTSDPNMAAACAPDGTCLVVWGTDSDLRALRLDASQSALDASPIVLMTDSVHEQPHVAYASGHFLVGWNAQSGVELRRVALDGTLPAAAPTSLPFSGALADPVVAAAGTQFLMAFESDAMLPDDLVSVGGTRVDAQGGVLDAQPLTLAARRSSEPSLRFAADSTGSMALWQHDADGLYQAMGDADGAFASPGGTALATHPSYSGLIDLSFDGVNYLALTYSGDDRGGLMGSRIAPDGTLVDESGGQMRSLLGLTSGRHPLKDARVLRRSDHYLAVWIDHIDRLKLQRFELDGSPRDLEPIQLATDRSPELDIACNTAGTCLLTSGKGDDLFLPGNVRALRLDAASNVLDREPFDLASNNQFDHASPRVVVDDHGQFTAVWSGVGSVSDTPGIWATRLDASGQITSHETIFEDVEPVSHPREARVVFDGNQYVLAWRNAVYQGDDHLYVARFDAELTRISQPVLATTSTATLSLDGLTTLAPGRQMLSYRARVGRWSEAFVWDAFGLPVTTRVELGQSCTRDEDCTSAYCAQGACATRPSSPDAGSTDTGAPAPDAGPLADTAPDADAAAAPDASIPADTGRADTSVDTGPPAVNDPGASDDSCACRSASGSQSTLPGALALLMLAGFAVVRRYREC